MSSSGRVEFELSLDDRKAIQRIEQATSRVEAMQNKLDQAGQKGSSSFAGVERSVVGLVSSLGAGIGIVQTFQDVLRQIEERAAAINREAEKSLSVGQSTSGSFGSFISNNPGMSAEEAQAVRGDLEAAIQQNPQQGENALGMAFAGLESSISAAPRLSMEQRVGAVSEALQVRQLNRGLEVGSTSAGIASLMQNFGMDPTQASNAIIATQQQSRVQSFEGVARGLARIAPAMGTAGLDPVDGMALFSYGTGVLEDPTGEQTSTNISNMMTRLTTRGSQIQEASGLSLQGNGLERLNQFVGARRSGMLNDATFSKVLPMIAEGQGQNMILSMINDNMAGFNATRSAIAGQDISGGDFLAGQLATAQADPSFASTGRLLEAQTNAGLLRSGDIAGQESAMVRQAMMDGLGMERLTDTGLAAAGETFDEYIRQGFGPVSAARAAENAGRFTSNNPLGPMINRIPGRAGIAANLDSMDYGDTLPGAEGVSSADYIQSIFDRLEQSLGQSIENGMTRALQNTQQRTALSGADQ